MNWQGVVAHKNTCTIANWPSSLLHHREKPSLECSRQFSKPLKLDLSGLCIGLTHSLKCYWFFFLAYFHSLMLQCLYNIHPRAGKCHLHLFMVLVWIYLMPGDAEHLFMCLPAICIFSFETCLSNSFAYLLIEFLLVCFDVLVLLEL